MDTIKFMIVHHSTCNDHTQTFIRCLKSIRMHYSLNTIYVSKSSVSVITDDIIREYNITVYNTPLDNSHIYGAMLLLNNIEDDNTVYCLLHDSMIIKKPLPESILTKRFYYNWHFDGKERLWEHRENIMKHILNTPLTTIEQSRLLDIYISENTSVIGLFGPSFGGNICTLRKIIQTIGLNQEVLPKFCGREELMAAERYIAAISEYLGVVDPFPVSYSLNGSIFQHPLSWGHNTSMMTIENIQNIKYDSFMFKSWIARP